jgi:hypothetical protein
VPVVVVVVAAETESRRGRLSTGAVIARLVFRLFARRCALFLRAFSPFSLFRNLPLELVSRQRGPLRPKIISIRSNLFHQPSTPARPSPVQARHGLGHLHARVVNARTTALRPRELLPTRELSRPQLAPAGARHHARTAVEWTVR